MSLTLKRAVPAAFVLAALSITSATKSVAQETTTPPSPAAPAAPVPPNAQTPDVDPQAMALAKQSVDAYQKLQAYSDTIDGGDEKAEIAWQKPDKFRYYVSSTRQNHKQTNTFAVSNGNTYWKRTYNDQQHYYREDADEMTADYGSMDAMLFLGSATSLTSAPWSLTSVTKPDPYPNALDVHPPKLVNLKMGQSDIVDGVPVDVISITQTLSARNKDFLFKTTLSLGKSDHLIRHLVSEEQRIDQGATQPQPIVHREERHRNIIIASTLPASTFVFTPPKGITLGIIKHHTDLTADNQIYYDKRLVNGAKPFPFTAKDLTGKPVSLTQYRGKVLVLDFWATWCGPCVAEMPNVIAAYNKHHSQGLEVVGISLDNQKSDLVNFIKENKVPYRQVFDGKGWQSAIATQYKVQAIPFMLVINKQGRIAAVNARGPELETAIAKALAAK